MVSMPVKWQGVWIMEGEFAGRDHFLGFRLQEADGWHYGWLHIDVIRLWGMSVLGYAYESEPDTPILAVVVPQTIPEPSCSVLVVLAILVFGDRRRR